MKKHAVWLVAAASLSSLSPGSRVAAAEKDGNTPAAEPRPGLVTELSVTGPHPSLGNQAEVVGRLPEVAFESFDGCGGRRGPSRRGPTPFT